MPSAAAHQEHDTAETPDLSSYAPAYRTEIRELLRQISGHAHKVATEFAVHFYAALGHRTPTATILNRLGETERERLQHQQARHLSLLMSPTLTTAAHFKRAQKIGYVHEMIGVELPLLLEAYHLYQLEIRRMLPTSGLQPQEQEQLGQALQQRLTLDMEAQITSHYRIDRKTADLLIEFDEAIRDAGNLSDLLQGAVQRISDLDGMLACLFLRPDAQGVLLIEAAGCSVGQQYAESMQTRRIPFIEIHPDKPAGQGPGGIAWRSGQIQVVESYDTDKQLEPWQQIGRDLGFRSSAAVPLLDDAGQSFALLSLYSPWPGFFNAPMRRTILQHLQQVLSHAVLRCEQGQVIPVQLRHEYRRLLEQKSLLLHYQPIIDLRSGKLQHVEALARLRGAGGKPISPAMFLPAFGKADRLHLFQLVLAQACRDLRLWRDRDLHAPISLNLPAEGMTDDAYRDVVFDTLQRGEVEPSQLRLEMLESYEPVDDDKRDTRLAEFKQAGIAIVQDDLGSGHSSLLRMDRIAFDEVKIDQGLVRNALGTPQRALEFIYHLTRLAHGFGVPVTVEGLENTGLIEAAAILGADHGQGFGIARPMPAAELSAWHERFVYTIDPQAPHTPLGALAGYLLWDQQLAALGRWPDLIEDFVRAPCLVGSYLARQGLQDSPLQALLASNHACALRGQDGAMYTHTKEELIRKLSQEWLRQIA